MHLLPINADLDIVVDLMRNLSLQSDPQQAASLYGRGLARLNIVPNDRYLSISRRDLLAPKYRITRNTGWTNHPNPWKEKEKLPVLSGGILSDILYSNKPAIITDLQSKISKDDPAFEALKDMELLVGLPHFDHGEAINVGVLLNRSAENFPFKDVPMMVWQANLWGRATLNLVNTQKLQAAYDTMDRELKVVADIQRSLLPPVLPEIRGVAMATHYQTSQRAGGDYYDFFPLPGGLWGILLADVSGHGTPAAVLMAITHAIAHTHPGHPMPPDQLLSFVNGHLARMYTQNNGNFVTAIYGIYSPGGGDGKSGGTLLYASAGHPPPRMVRGGKIVEVEGDTSFPLGIHAGERFISHTVELQRGDRLLFYTDGITEAFDREGELFGEARLDEVCVRHATATPEKIVRGVLEALEDFSKGAAVTDDRTLLVMGVG